MKVGGIMSDNESLGFVETHGLAAGIETADAMVKAARVRVKTVLNADGLISVVCEGDLAACRAALEAGKASAERMGGYVSCNLIARPDDDTGAMINEYVDAKITAVSDLESSKVEPSSKTEKAKGKGKK